MAINIKNYITEYRTKSKERRKHILSENCEELEQLDKEYDTFHVHKKIKEMTAHKKRKNWNSAIRGEWTHFGRTER